MQSLWIPGTVLVFFRLKLSCSLFYEKYILIYTEVKDFQMLIFIFRFKKFDHRYLRKILIRKNLPKSSIVSLYKKLEMKQAIEMVEMGILSSTTFPTPHL